jgi:DNA excision repair protein ERCC-2
MDHDLESSDNDSEPVAQKKLVHDEIFPYQYRTGQKNIVEKLLFTMAQGKHLAMESGTGTGKTISGLTPAITTAINSKKRILYLTRTNSQQRQVVLELRNIRRKLPKDSIPQSMILGIGLQGRSNLCSLFHTDPELAEGTPEELSKLCSDKKNIARKIHKGENVQDDERARACRYFGNIINYDQTKIFRWVKNNLPTPEELNEYCATEELCTYEVNKNLVRNSLLVTAPYIYVFNKYILQYLLEWMNCNVEDIILIIDEAHNLPDFARELSSAEISIYSLGKARDEAMEFGNPSVGENILITELCDHLQEILYSFQDNYVTDDDGFVPPSELEVELMSRFKCTSKTLEQITNDLVAHGMAIQEARRKRGRLPRSYIHSMGGFLLFWHDLDSERYTKLIRSGENVKLEIYCLDPSVVTEVCNDFGSSIHMSGTLRPLDEYRDSIGIPQDSELEVYPSPFPPDNLVKYFCNDVTTRYEQLIQNKQLIPKLEDYVVKICNATDRNTVIFFPSFGLMQRFLNDRITARINRELYQEEQGMRQAELMELVESFKLAKKGVLFAVIGGRISEGLDFPEEELEVAVLVGIPYPRPTAKHRALEHYYEVKFGKGWEYAVHAPTTRKLLQSIGRLIRNENDRGFVMFLDNRAQRFRDDLQGLRESWDPVKDIKDFFK